jgi:predicted small secreted protein
MSIEAMRRATQFLLTANTLLCAALLSSCETMPQGIQQARIEMVQHIAAEPAGDYFIGRRYYKPDYKFWGYVRRPGQPWSTAELVMLNEKQKLAPDRERLDFGSDNNYEYKLYGNFSGDKVYEPASNGIYPEFVLKGYELISTNPPPIFRSQFRGHASPTDLRYVVEKPE